MTKLTLYPVLNVDELVRPDQAELLTVASPAMAFFTDFMRTEPLVIEAELAAAAARQVMLTTHVRLQLVVDKQGAFVGVISAQDLSEQAIVRHIGERRVARSRFVPIGKRSGYEPTRETGAHQASRAPPSVMSLDETRRATMSKVLPPSRPPSPPRLDQGRGEVPPPVALGLVWGLGLVIGNGCG